MHVIKYKRSSRTLGIIDIQLTHLCSPSCDLYFKIKYIFNQEFLKGTIFKNIASLNFRQKFLIKDLLYKLYKFPINKSAN